MILNCARIFSFQFKVVLIVLGVPGPHFHPAQLHVVRVYTIENELVTVSIQTSVSTGAPEQRQTYKLVVMVLANKVRLCFLKTK